MPEITKQDALRWLDMQRDAINTEIAYAAPSDKGQYFGNLKIVNWLVDRVNEMTAVEYLEARKELCDANDGMACLHCPMVDCRIGEKHHPRRAVEIVKRWKEEQL